MSCCCATHLCADLAGVSAQGLQHACSHALALAQQAQQDVLRANVVVACGARGVQQQEQQAACECGCDTAALQYLCFS